jgi:hypothetical protein
MFQDLYNLTGVVLGREAERCLYGLDCDAPSAQPHHPFMAYNSAWGSMVGGAMTRVYNTRAKSLGLPALWATTGPTFAKAHGPASFC